jgi:hypothetical protein
MGLPRVLFLTPDINSYLADSLFHGLRTLLGPSLVDYPKHEIAYRTFPRERLRGLYGRGFTLYGLLEDIDVERYGALDRMRHGEFDLVVFPDITMHFGLFCELVPDLKRAGVRVAVLDGTDFPAPYPYSPKWWRRPYWWFLPRAHRRSTYFKRELMPLTQTFRYFGLLPPPVAGLLPTRIRQTSFSIPEQKLVPAAPSKTKLFAAHVVDPEVASHLGDGRTSYVFEREEDYYADLQSARFGITTKKAGWDTLRHYEIAANGAVPCFRDLDRKPSSCAPHGLDESNCVIYHSAGDLMDQVQGMDQARYGQLQSGALAWAARNTTRQRALELLESMGLSEIPAAASSGGVAPERIAPDSADVLP